VRKTFGQRAETSQQFLWISSGNGSGTKDSASSRPYLSAMRDQSLFSSRCMSSCELCQRIAAFSAALRVLLDDITICFIFGDKMRRNLCIQLLSKIPLGSRSAPDSGECLQALQLVQSTPKCSRAGPSFWSTCSGALTMLTGHPEHSPSYGVSGVLLEPKRILLSWISCNLSTKSRKPTWQFSMSTLVHKSRTIRCLSRLYKVMDS
jgi:hypothetical protein